eukprot:762969-Hanusia_phi.AAC.3
MCKANTLCQGRLTRIPIFLLALHEELVHRLAALLDVPFEQHRAGPTSSADPSGALALVPSSYCSQRHKQANLLLNGCNTNATRHWSESKMKGNRTEYINTTP